MPQVKDYTAKQVMKLGCETAHLHKQASRKRKNKGQSHHSRMRHRYR